MSEWIESGFLPGLPPSSERALPPTSVGATWESNRDPTRFIEAGPLAQVRARDALVSSRVGFPKTFCSLFSASTPFAIFEIALVPLELGTGDAPGISSPGMLSNDENVRLGEAWVDVVRNPL
jgi:hypothetical protein